MVSFKLFAGTDVGLRDNNEDNFTVCPDLTQNEWMMPADHQQVLPLGEYGCLMVVADGMGGQNAGEVASAIAIEIVQTMFAPDCLTDKILSKSASIKDYLKKVVSKADSNVKEYSKEHHEAEGLGSTIVMAWVIGDRAYIAWLGDSRAYAFIPNQGIKRLSKDHSYVQQLVDAGKLSDIDAMNHPNSNVITRSLGDTSQKAKADVEEYLLENGEIILLCSDGLCGVCTDDEIAGVLEEEADDLQVCKEQLTELALDNGGSDNITIALMQIVSEKDGDEDALINKGHSYKKLLLGIMVLLVLAVLGISFLNRSKHLEPKLTNEESFSICDSVIKDTLIKDTIINNVNGKVDSSHNSSNNKSLLKLQNEGIKSQKQLEDSHKSENIDVTPSDGNSSDSSKAIENKK